MIKWNKETFIKKAKEIQGDKYDYSLVEFKTVNEKVKIICPVHGIFEQRPLDHIKGKKCAKCAHKYKPTTEEFVKKAKEVHGDKYDYSLVDYKNNKALIKIICPIHGVFEQVARNHLKGSGCKKCYNEDWSEKLKLSKEEFVKKAKEVHGDKYDYSLVDYKGLKFREKIICPVHGVFEQCLLDHIYGGTQHLGSGCPNCKESKGEEKIRLWLENENIEYKYNKSYLNIYSEKGKRLRYDFYIPSKKMYIEYNGEQHYKWYKKYQTSYHRFLVQCHHDWLKRKYFKKNKDEILLTIPYWDYKIIDEILKEKIYG